MKRIFLIILDSFGIGNAPDAADFADEGSNTLRAVMLSQKFWVPNLKKLGLFEIEGTPGPKGGPAAGAFGRLTEVSRGIGSLRASILPSRCRFIPMDSRQR